MWVMWAFNEFMNYLRILLDCFSKVVVILWCWNRFRKNWTCLIKVFYPDCSNRWGFSKTHVQVWVWFEGTPNFHFLFSFPSVIYIQVITLFATEPMFFVSERGRVPRVVVCEVVYTHVIFLHLCVWFWPCVCMCEHTVCIVGAGALLSQPITFTSTPNLSWVSRVRVKAERVTTRKWLLPHRKWGRRRGNGSGKVAEVFQCGHTSKTVRMKN